MGFLGDLWLAGPACGVGGVVNASELAVWVERLRARQGLPAKVTDPAVIRSVVVLLGGGGEAEPAPA